MDRWAWEQLDPWLELRAGLPGRAAVLRAARPDPRPPVRAGGDPRPAAPRRRRLPGVRRRFAPHQLRHAHAVEMSREGIPLLVIQRQLGHADLADHQSRYLRGIDNTEIIHAVHERSSTDDPRQPQAGARPVSVDQRDQTQRARPGGLALCSATRSR